MKFIALILIVVFSLFPTQKQQKDLVPNEVTAIKIAEAIWLPLYGEEIYEKEPFFAFLQGDTVWHVYGSLPAPCISTNERGDTIWTITTGGVPHIYINKDDARIIRVYHTK